MSEHVTGGFRQCARRTRVFELCDDISWCAMRENFTCGTVEQVAFCVVKINDVAD